MRLFVCIECDALTEEIAQLQGLFEEASGLRFTDPEQAHLTLKFLSDTERVPPVTDAIATAVDEAGVGSFELTAGGFGVFPDIEYIQVLWLGIETGSDHLTQLHHAIENQTTALGFEEETHSFTPHITLARMDHAGGKSLVQELVRSRDPTAGTLHVDSLTLLKSTLTSDGPTYSPVERFELP